MKGTSNIHNTGVACIQLGWPSLNLKRAGFSTLNLQKRFLQRRILFIIMKSSDISPPEHLCLPVF